MTYGEAREWYGSVRETLPILTSRIEDAADRQAAARELDRQMSLAAILSLYDPNLAPEFFVRFVQDASQAQSQASA